MIKVRPAKDLDETDRQLYEDVKESHEIVRGLKEELQQVLMDKETRKLLEIDIKAEL